MIGHAPQPLAESVGNSPSPGVGVSSANVRELDIVVIEMCVEKVFPDYLQLILKTTDVAFEKGGGVRVAINYPAVIEHRPRPPDVGHRVKFTGNPNSISGRILHIVDGMAWVRWDSGNELVAMSCLERDLRA